MSAAAKDTIYIDAEDEITAIIDKVRGSSAKVVALVLPKRAQTLQSIVNLKLLKRSATQAKKNLVLITSDPNLLPLAGAVGMHVAKTPQSKPEVPASPATQEHGTGDKAAAMADAKSQPAPNVTSADSQEETIDLDNDTPKPDSEAKSAKGAVAGKKLFNKKLKVPDFDRFRLVLFGGVGLLIVVIVGSIFAFNILPKATIRIQTDTTSVTTELMLKAQTAAKELDKENLIVPAIKKEIKKTENERAPATGQKNVGEKATGTVSLKNCSASVQAVTVPAGTPVSSNNVTFLTDESVELPPSTFNFLQQCTTLAKSVDVTAQVGGDNYNLGARDYTVTGFSGVRASGSDMSGGTTKLVQVISQADINAAKEKVLERLANTAKNEFKTQFSGDDMLALEDTYGANQPVVTATPNANEEGTEATVTVTITYTQLGVDKNDLKQLIEENVAKNIDSSKQAIRDNGLDQATIRIVDKKSADEATFSISTISIAGPQLDAEGIKKEIAGKKKGPTVKAIESRPGIKDVEIDYSPFWVFSTPKRTDKINITFDQNNAR